MKVVHLQVLLLVFCSCANDSKKVFSESKTASAPAGSHLVNSFGMVGFDTSAFKKLTCGLYINAQGTIGYQAIDNSLKFDTVPMDIYLVSVYYADPHDHINNGQKLMKDVVDTNTFEILHDFYFKDKNHVYNYNPMMDGGTIAINIDADVKTFHVLEGGLYAKDQKYCYYRGTVIEGPDLKTFRVDTTLGRFLAMDKNNFYDGYHKMSEDNINELKIREGFIR